MRQLAMAAATAIVEKMILLQYGVVCRCCRLEDHLVAVHEWSGPYPRWLRRRRIVKVERQEECSCEAR